MTRAKKTDTKELRNVPVKTLRNHCNSHGGKFEKKKGETYVHPKPHADIVAGVVELAAETKTKA